MEVVVREKESYLVSNSIALHFFSLSPLDINGQMGKASGCFFVQYHLEPFCFHPFAILSTTNHI